jgi:hypothetical protein
MSTHLVQHPPERYLSIYSHPQDHLQRSVNTYAGRRKAHRDARDSRSL